MIRGIQVKAVDSAGRDLGPEEVGELVVKGPGIFSGYWEKPESTREVEEALYTHPEVFEAVVIGVPDPAKGEIPKAFVQLKEGSSVDDQQIISYCKDRMAAYKVPRQVEFVCEFPKSPTGKILKRVMMDSLN